MDTTTTQHRLVPAVEASGRPRLLRLPRHRASTAQACVLYPFQSDEGIGARGICLGTTWPGRAGWFYDPFVLYGDGLLDNPNIMVYGEPGSGKSTFVKTFLAREVGLLGKGPTGRQAFIIDPKSEYQGLAEALSMSVIKLRPGGTCRLNPLACPDGSTETDSQTLSRRTRLVVALLSSVAGRSLSREEDAIVGWGLEALSFSDQADVITLVDLARLLERPSEEMARRSGLSVLELGAAARGVWMDLDKLVRRDLAGMFDGDDSLELAFASSGTGVVFDVSAVFNDKGVLRLVMLAAISALEAIYMVGDAEDEALVPRRFLVVDECWSILQNEEATRFLQEQWKLARKRGVANIAICHRITDLGAQADNGSAIAKIGEGLLADAQTQVVFRTSAHVLDQTRAALGLTASEAAELPRLPKACALWKVRSHSAFVCHVRSTFEASFTDTDGRLTP